MGIYIVRHAESEANINGRTLSHASIQLSQTGLDQANNLVKRLPPIDHVIVSKYRRTQQTAQPVIDAYAIDFEIDSNLHEFSYLSESKCANTTLSERKAWVDAYWDKMDVEYLDAEDAESFKDLYHRVKAFTEKLEHLEPHYKDKHLLIVSHGQFIQLLMMYVNQRDTLSAKLMQDFRSALINSPIKNAQIFSYSLNSIEVCVEDNSRVEKSNS